MTTVTQDSSQPALTTEADRLLEQLRTWSQHDPDFCRIERTNFSGGHDIDVRVGDTWFTIWATTFGAISSSGLAMLLSALMSAIAIKEWLLDLEFYKHSETSELRWDVMVYSAGRLAVDEPYRGDHTQAAIALLTAFLAALEGKHGHS
ncbi:MAG: hypothetical protein KME27_10900 [Lyngbya sp. HA4199-MV5]|jgi:hypothetical protein|nr:hypothetical protein [Lyngbya sp. HA4199-MV5]